MIKLNEIRIGNILNGDMYDMGPVHTIESNSSVVIETHDAFFAYDIKDLYYRKIEERTFQATGFQKVNSNWVLDRVYIYCVPAESDRYYSLPYHDEEANFEIKYVHQLQNLYHALTGKELVFDFTRCK